VTDAISGHDLKSPESEARDGVICAAIAFFLWGVFPIYFVIVKDVSAMELLMHRVVWAVPFGAIIIHLRKQWPEVMSAFRNRRTLKFLTLSALVITGNWLVYIWAVQLEQINVVIFGERLRKAQTMAVILAAIGVGILAARGGQFPAIALFLGTAFAVYGVIRKQVDVGGMPGLFIETVLLLPFAFAYLAWIMVQGEAEFSWSDPYLAGLLVIAGPLTVTPLLFFALAARRLNLSTIGMMQYIAPTLQFAIAVFYGEELTLAHIVCFTLIWMAVILFSIDAWRTSRALARIGL
jgi:chloramphenicol-sensitive protein RarD